MRIFFGSFESDNVCVVVVIQNYILPLSNEYGLVETTQMVMGRPFGAQTLATRLMCATKRSSYCSTYLRDLNVDDIIPETFVCTTIVTRTLNASL